MHDESITTKLENLTKGSNRSATARIREIFDQIESALNSGVRRKDIHQALLESGFEITFSSFELAIHRIRKQRGDSRNSNISKVTTPSEKIVSGPASKSDYPFNLDLQPPPQFKRTRKGDNK